MRQEKVKFCYISKLPAFAGKFLEHYRTYCDTDGCCARSDIHFWKHGRIGSLVVEGDCILGHEAAGIVLQCGEDVSTLQPGMWIFMIS